MDDKKQKAIVVGGIALLILLIKLASDSKSGIVFAPPGDSGQSVNYQDFFNFPYYDINKELPDLGGGNTYNSTINQIINPSLGMQLSRQYMPMFGFVGVTTVGITIPGQPQGFRSATKTTSQSTGTRADYPGRRTGSSSAGVSAGSTGQAGPGDFGVGVLKIPTGGTTKTGFF